MSVMSKQQPAKEPVAPATLVTLTIAYWKARLNLSCPLLQRSGITCYVDSEIGKVIILKKRRIVNPVMKDLANKGTRYSGLWQRDCDVGQKVKLQKHPDALP